VSVQQHSARLQEAWNLANDSLRVPICVRFQTLTIACACIFLAARRVGFSMPEDPPWWDVLGIPLSDMETIALEIQSLYILPKPEYISINKGETAASLDMRRAEQCSSRGGERARDVCMHSERGEGGERSDIVQAALDSDSSRHRSPCDLAGASDVEVALPGWKASTRAQGSDRGEISVHAAEQDYNGVSRRQDAGEVGNRRRDHSGAKVPSERVRDRDREKSGAKDTRERERERRRDGKHRERDRDREQEGLRDRERSRHRERERHKGRKGGGDAGRWRGGPEHERGSGGDMERVGSGKTREQAKAGAPWPRSEVDAQQPAGTSKSGSPVERLSRRHTSATSGSGNYLVDEALPVPGPPPRAREQLNRPPKSPSPRFATDEVSPRMPGPPARSRKPIELASSSPSPPGPPPRIPLPRGALANMSASDDEDNVQTLPGRPLSTLSRPTSQKALKRASSSPSPSEMPPLAKSRLGERTSPGAPGKEAPLRGAGGGNSGFVHRQEVGQRRAPGFTGGGAGFLAKLDGSGSRVPLVSQHGPAGRDSRARPQSPSREQAARGRGLDQRAGVDLSGRRSRVGADGEDLESLRALVQKRERSGPSARKQSA
jgi:hypothetical protein